MPPRLFLPSLFSFLLASRVLGAPTYELVYSFSSAARISPQGEIYIDPELNIYGTTYSGGVGNGGFGNGVVYKITRDGTATNIVEFTGIGGAKPGRGSRGGMLLGNDGNFYSTTEAGGSSDRGVIFRLTPDGTYTVLGNFTGTTTGNARGGAPRGILHRDGAGTIWGTTIGGGSAHSGTIWRLPLGGSIETLYDFAMSAGLPPDGLLPGAEGDFYGITSSGAYRLFRFSNGNTFSLLGAVSGSPGGGIRRFADNHFYGTTSSGGLHGRGTIFRATPEGAVTTLYDLGGPGSLGESNSRAGLAIDPLGNLYGVTNQGGTANAGTIFRYSAGGTFSNVVSFTGDGGAAPGQYPSSTPAWGPDGNLYGTAMEGGSPSGTGVLWRLRFGPTPATLAASDVTRSAAQLNGTLKANGSASTVVFEWGTSPSALTNTTNPQSVGGSVGTFAASATLLGLNPGATYYFRARGDNADQFQPQRGEILSFTTPPNAPPVAENRTLHAPAVGVPTIVYSATANTTDTDGDMRTLSIQAYGGAGSAETNGVSLTYISAGFVGTETITVRASDPFGGSDDGLVTLTNAGPTAADDEVEYFGFPVTANVIANDTDADLDTLQVIFTTPPVHGTVDIVNATTIRYTPGDTFSSADSFSYSVSDQHGGTASATVRIVARNPISWTIASEGLPVPGAGALGTAIPAGALWTHFGVPSINGMGQISFVGSYRVPGSPVETSVFSRQIKEASAPVATKGQPPLGAGTGVSFASFKDPLQNERGDTVFLATLSGKGVTRANDQAIYWAISPGGCELIAREGAQPPGVPVGARWKAFTNLALGEWALENAAAEGVGPQNAVPPDVKPLPLLAFTAQLQAGLGDVTSANDTGLWLATAGETGVFCAVALREGKPLTVLGAQKPVKRFVTLAPMPNAPGQGGGVTSRGVLARITFTDNSQALLRFFLQQGETGTPEMGMSVVAASGYPIATLDESIAQIGPWTQSAGGSIVGWLSGVTNREMGTVALAWRMENGPIEVIARRGDAVSSQAGDQPVIGDILGAVVNDANQHALLCTLAGSGVTPANNLALVCGTGTGATAERQVVAREGMQPPGVAGGARWMSFASFAISEDCSLSFTGRMRPGPGGVSSANDFGLWATGGDGRLHLLLREGQPIGPARVKSFTVLSAVPNSLVQTRSIARSRVFLVHITDTLGTEHLRRIVVP